MTSRDDADPRGGLRPAKAPEEPLALDRSTSGPGRPASGPSRPASGPAATVPQRTPSAQCLPLLGPPPANGVGVCTAHGGVPWDSPDKAEPTSRGGAAPTAAEAAESVLDDASLAAIAWQVLQWLWLRPGRGGEGLGGPACWPGPAPGDRLAPLLVRVAPRDGAAPRGHRKGRPGAVCLPGVGHMEATQDLGRGCPLA